MANTPIVSENQAQAILKAAPANIVAPSSAPGASKTGIPAQKVVAGGIGGVIAWVLLATLAHFGLDVQALATGLLGPNAPDAQAVLSGIIALAVANYVPPSQRDPDSNVSSVLAPTLPAPGQPATIIPPAKKDQ